MSGSYDSRVLAERFHLATPPTVLARTASVAPIAFTRLFSDRAGNERARDVPAEKAFSFHVSLNSTAADFWRDGRHWQAASAEPGSTFLFDLQSNPVSQIHRPYDVVRFYISQASLDEMAYAEGNRPARNLLQMSLGAHDRTMHGLATALLDRIEMAHERSALFIDHIALAFHAHVTQFYGATGNQDPLSRGQLAPWQLRRAVEFISAHLDGDPTIAQLARECGLSAGYFARAFRRTTGVTPHQWLMRKRVERAREMLLSGGLGLADVAIICGFVDQSHFSRVFAKFHGLSPGRWRQQNRGL